MLPFKSCFTNDISPPKNYGKNQQTKTQYYKLTPTNKILYKYNTTSSKNKNRNWSTDLYFLNDEHFNVEGAKLLFEAIIERIN